MRQTPFGVWNPSRHFTPPIRECASMRQTPFGVWNHFCDLVVTGIAVGASMRQTPFGVWNILARGQTGQSPACFNEADAFRRLESVTTATADTAANPLQ